MTSATDIITYIGIPLAVLGVLPILYTFLLAVLNQRRIRRALVRTGHKPTSSSKQKEDGFTIRSSPMTTLIEVELPKYAIAPLERSDDRYWRLNGRNDDSGTEKDHLLLDRAESTLSTIEEGRVQGFLRGGSWRAFQWKTLVVGKKLYRIQYEDELREPPAEIDFSELIHFLLDWGAELEPLGWEKLRSGGLWTPAGTVLLAMGGDDDEPKKGHKEWILRTSMPDDADGILSLCVKWPANCYDIQSTRGALSLPPGWGRISQPILVKEPENEEVEIKSEELVGKTAKTKETKDLSSHINELKSDDKKLLAITSVRFKVEAGQISTVYFEHNNQETGTSASLTHLSDLPSSQAWFTTTTAALLLNSSTNSSGALWGFTPPVELTTFARKDTLPVGVLVLCGILRDEDAPHWSSASDRYNAIQKTQASQFHSRFMARLAAERLEATMPPEQAKAARDNRQMADMRLMSAEMSEREDGRRRMEEQRLQDALTSVRMGNQTVKSFCLDYLKTKGKIGASNTVSDVAVAALWLIILDRTTATAEKTESSTSRGLGYKILKILDEWMSWANAGGMKKDQFELLQGWEVEFCMAICMVAVVQEAAILVQNSSGKGTGVGKASMDMLECLDLWKKVRLG